MQTERWPALRVADWTSTRDALHLWTQIVGKVRMAKAPMVNHWWHVTFAVTPRGLTTGAIPDGNRYFEMTFDFVDQVLRIEVQGGERREIPLAPGSVAAFYAATMAALSELAIDVEIWPVPVEIEHVTPFADDVEPRDYDPAQARLFWLQLVQASRVLSIFRGALRRQGEPGPLLLGRDRPRRHPLLGAFRAEAPWRRAQLRRLGDGRGLLARARELRLLAGRRRGGRVLRLRLSGARRLQGAADPRRRRRTTTPMAVSSCCPTRRCAVPPTPTPPCWPSSRTPTRPRPTSAGGTARRSTTCRSSRADSRRERRLAERRERRQLRPVAGRQPRPDPADAAARAGDQLRARAERAGGAAASSRRCPRCCASPRAGRAIATPRRRPSWTTA